eukprot:CAMPEP_0204857850 /NCGR_PEP_ID=MMETSP1347-20130617/21425_1 /ASSEMBLY_ACC=CAM_ASM_000690 /TAXON_ID=215587 /ORGANISM="Aplanochytrium stocchinoi, Strain GSBS06" /LENGTH=54 /DNA_ID=CAMNT_0052005517 /DNA_START=165 /DNA_END=329 /DNA_ORIENTATION=+
MSQGGIRVDNDDGLVMICCIWDGDIGTVFVFMVIFIGETRRELPETESQSLVLI